MTIDKIPGFQLYSDIVPSKVEWLWYPYIPYGKLTILQGNPGDGKSTMMMNIIGKLTSKGILPDGSKIEPINVIYQCGEDDKADTIKPRLIAAEADCEKIACINEDIMEITLDDEYLRNAISYFNAKLLVVDPFQAYIGDAQITNVTCMRRILRRLGMWASAYNCAVVLIGHLNKNHTSKELYRGLGSIDIIAAARSVLQIERREDNPEIRVLHQIKSSLAPKGDDAYFSIDADSSVKWMYAGMDVGNIVFSEDNPIDDYKHMNKQEKTVEMIKSLLHDGPVEANTIMKNIQIFGISKRTINIAKKIMGVNSVRKNGKWYWQLGEHENGRS